MTHNNTFLMIDCHLQTLNLKDQTFQVFQYGGRSSTFW